MSLGWNDERAYVWSFGRPDLLLGFEGFQEEQLKHHYHPNLDSQGYMQHDC